MLKLRKSCKNLKIDIHRHFRAHRIKLKRYIVGIFSIDMTFKDISLDEINEEKVLIKKNGLGRNIEILSYF